PVPRLKFPTIFEFAKTEEQRRILEFHAASLETGRPWLAPPNVPAERVNALRRAFDTTMKDPAFLDEVKQRRFEVDPRTGEQIEAVLRSIASLPPELIAKAGEMARKLSTGRSSNQKISFLAAEFHGEHGLRWRHGRTPSPRRGEGWGEGVRTYR